MEEWKECRLGDFFELHRGYDLTKSEIKTGPYPVVCSTSIMGYHSEYKVRAPGVVIGRSGTLGEVQFIDKDFWPHNTSLYVSDFKGNSPKFIKYFLQLFGTGNVGGGSAVPTLNRNHLQALAVKVPPLPTQQKIAAILSSLDDKIELNNKINTNLEQQAGALFKNWFVDFEPFGGKMPEGWKEADIYSIANIIYGSPFASKLFNTEKNGKPIIRIRDLKDQHSDVYTPEERDDAYLIQPKDIVVGMDGEFRPYIWGSEPGWLNQRVCVFENKRPKGKAFLYFSIKLLLDVVEKTQVATTVIHIGKKDFDKFQITLPTKDILDNFDELTDPILDQIVANRLENRRLSELRDALLPKLMNGEVEI